ncbi:hypothetical protein T01_6583 [Trichinella spiralis]|uniref:Uncharacterized protein n=1 Tax=Trichinella spiralis TaxID=6334 RepID=A0A0V1BR77_TRISP|nr:hypothetical protein T01_6583 [Trichinella spiralis]
MYILNIILGNDCDVKAECISWKHYSSSVIYYIMSYFETVKFQQSSTISATSQAKDRQVRITKFTSSRLHQIPLYSQILRVRASFNLAIESRRKQFDK